MDISEWQKICPQLKNVQFRIPDYVRYNCVNREFESGTVILRKGDKIDHMQLLLKGTVNIMNEFESGDSLCFAQTKALNTIGEIEFLAKKNIIASSCIAETRCKTLQIPFSVLEKWIHEDNEFLRFITTSLAKKNYTASYLRGMEKFYPSCHLLKYYLIQHLETEINGEKAVTLNKSRQNIAEELGISVRSVNRAIHKLKENSMVCIHKGKLTLDGKQLSDLKASLEAVE